MRREHWTCPTNADGTDGNCDGCGRRRGDLILIRHAWMCRDCAAVTCRRFPSLRPTQGQVLAEAARPTPHGANDVFFCTDVESMGTAELRAEHERLRQALLLESDRPSPWRLERFRWITAALRRRGVQV